MCNKRIKLNLMMTWLVGVTVCCAASVVLAGPLDRGEMQPRNNPAASSMIRVPGVLGQSERYALEILQRAGLNVNTKYIRQPVKKYAGRSGMVVKQTPSAGGISMLGSSVTIMIYKVEDKPIDKSAGAYDDAGGYDNAGGGSGNAGGGYDGSTGGGYNGGAGGDDGSVGGGYNGGAAGGGYDGSVGSGYNGGAASGGNDGNDGSAGDGYNGSAAGGDYDGSAGGSYNGNAGGSYNDNTNGGTGNPGGNGYPDKAYPTDKAAPKNRASGQDWGSPRSDFVGGSAP